MLATLSSHCPVIPYAGGSAPRVTQSPLSAVQLVSGTEPVSTAPSSLPRVEFAFGRNGRSIRCRPAAKQNVVPVAALSITSAAFWSVPIVVPLQAGASVGPAGKLPGGSGGGVGFGEAVGETVGVGVGVGVGV